MIIDYTNIECGSSMKIIDLGLKERIAIITMAVITAPGTASLCGTVSFKNTLRLSQAQRLNSKRSERSWRK